MEVLFLNFVKRKFFSILLICLTFSCTKKDSLPEFTFTFPLYLKWKIDDIEYEYRVGENALFSRSFVLPNGNGSRKFVYELHINEAEFCRISFLSTNTSEKPEKDLMNLLNTTEGLPFKTASNDQPGSVLIEMFAADRLTNTTEWSLNNENKLIIKSLRDFSVSGKRYIETEINFSCYLLSVKDSSIAEVTNGEGLIAFRYR